MSENGKMETPEQRQLRIALNALHALIHIEEYRPSMLDKLQHRNPVAARVVTISVGAMREVERAGGPKAPH